jgi:hypothetical protein
MNIPLLIGDQNGASSSYGHFTSSPPLFSPGASNLSNLNDDDDLMLFREFVTPPFKKDCLMSTFLKKVYILSSQSQEETKL